MAVVNTRLNLLTNELLTRKLTAKRNFSWNSILSTDWCNFIIVLYRQNSWVKCEISLHWTCHYFAIRISTIQSVYSCSLFVFGLYTIFLLLFCIFKLFYQWWFKLSMLKLITRNVFVSWVVEEWRLFIEEKKIRKLKR